MVCPVDSTELVMTDRQGVEIDYCPKCRGVWLDRGELDKIIERGASYEAEHHASAAPQRGYDERRESRDHHDYDNRPDYRDNHQRYSSDHRGDPRRKHKREGFLGDLFDFGD